MFSAALLGMLRGLPIPEIALWGQAAAAVCAECSDAVNPRMNMELLQQRINAELQG